MIPAPAMNPPISARERVRAAVKSTVRVAALPKRIKTGRPFGIYAEAYLIADDHRVNRNRRPW